MLTNFRHTPNYIIEISYPNGRTNEFFYGFMDAKKLCIQKPNKAEMYVETEKSYEGICKLCKVSTTLMASTFVTLTLRTFFSLALISVLHWTAWTRAGFIRGKREVVEERLGSLGNMPERLFTLKWLYQSPIFWPCRGSSNILKHSPTWGMKVSVFVSKSPIWKAFSLSLHCSRVLKRIDERMPSKNGWKCYCLGTVGVPCETYAKKK